MRKLLIIFVFLCSIVSVTGCKKNNIPGDSENGEGSLENNELIYLNQTDTIDGEKLWSHSTTRDNLKLKDSFIKLDDITKSGILETKDFYVDPFSELVPTWNIHIDGSSMINIFVAVGNTQGYSEYYTMALWKETYKASLSKQEDAYGKVSVDTIISKKTDIDRIKFKVIFAKSNTEVTALKNISITTVPKDKTNNFDFSVLQEKTITVEPRQQLSIPNIGNSICSPTSLSMVLNYYNHSESQSIVAGRVHDKASNMYGNWSFNASYAGGFTDLYSRVEYASDLATLMKYIHLDQPLILSIQTRSISALEGTIMAYPAGHLLVLTGFKQVDGIWYATVSDPAEYEDSKVNREYKLHELLEAWRGYMYVVQTTPF